MAIFSSGVFIAQKDMGLSNEKRDEKNNKNDTEKNDRIMMRKFVHGILLIQFT